MKYFPLILSITTGVSALIGDFVVFDSTFSANSKIFKAIADNFVHAAIGFLSALTFFSHDNFNLTNNSTISNIVLCTMTASFIDLDHVLLAKSLNIKDLTNLKQRGIFHCTTGWLLVITIIFLMNYFTKKDYQVFIFMLLLAVASHHTRDANRRGFWMTPFGNSPPLTKPMYVSVLCLLPNIVYYLYKYTRVSQKYVPITYINV